MKRNNDLDLIAEKLLCLNLDHDRKRHIKGTESSVTIKDGLPFVDKKSITTTSLIITTTTPCKKKNKSIYKGLFKPESSYKDIQTKCGLIGGRDINFYKIPKKIIDEVDEVDDLWDDDNDITDNPNAEDIRNLPFPVMEDDPNNIYKNFYRRIANFYIIFYTYFSSEDFIFDEDKIEVANSQIMSYLKSDLSFFTMNIKEHYLNKNLRQIQEMVFNVIKLYEDASLGLLIFYFQFQLNLYFSFCDEMPLTDITNIYVSHIEIFNSLYEVVMLILKIVLESNIKEKTNGNITKGEDNEISKYKSLCEDFIQSYYEDSVIPSTEEIIGKIYSLKNTMNQKITQIIDTISEYFSQVVELEKETTQENEDHKEEVNFIEKLNSIFNDEKTLNRLKKKEFYSNNIKYIETFIPRLLEIFNKLKKDNTAIPPYLPPINERYKYTLVLDLDETLVHYNQEGENIYVQVRPGAEDFLALLENCYEIIIFTAASKDYADLVTKELDKSNSITTVLYRKYTVQKDGAYLKDLSKLGRDLKRTLIVDNNAENFTLQKENGLEISGFYGDQNDEELSLLGNDLLELYNMNLDDIREGLDLVRDKMCQRYMKLLQDMNNK